MTLASGLIGTVTGATSSDNSVIGLPAPRRLKPLRSGPIGIGGGAPAEPAAIDGIPPVFAYLPPDQEDALPAVVVADIVESRAAL